MSTQDDDQNTVRAKRLAKLTSSAPAPATQKEAAANASSSTQQSSSSSSMPRARTETPLELVQNKEPEKVTKEAPPPKPTTKPPPVEAPVISIEEWEDEAISKIMLVTLDPAKAEQDSDYIFLQTVLDDLTDKGQEIRFSTSVLDQSILFRSELDDGQTPFHYLLGAWERTIKMARSIRVDRDNQAKEKLHILNEIRRLCISYAGLSLTTPEMFGDAPQETDLSGYLLQDIGYEVKLPEEFINDLAKRFYDDGELAEVIAPTIVGISEEIASMKLYESYGSPIRAMTLLVQNKLIASVLPEIPNWIPSGATSGAAIEHTILGRFFALSPLAQGVTQHYFPDAKHMTPANRVSMSKNVQESLHRYQDYIFKICDAIVRSGLSGRRGMLDWFSAALALNTKRKALQVDPATVASDGFMINLVAVLNKFADPFVDIQAKRIDKVDVNYFRTIPVGRTNPRVSIKEETKLKADNTQAEEFLSQTIENTDPHFISEIFFLNCYAHNIGLNPAMQAHLRCEGEISDMQRQIDRVTQTENWRQAAHAALLSAVIDRTKKQIELVSSLEATMEAVMYDRISQEKSLDFLGFVANWLLRLVDERHAHPTNLIKLPLPEEVPIEWRCLPQFLFEIITDHMLYVMRIPELVGDRARPELIILALTFIGPSGSAYIQNPHLKAKLAEMLYWGTLKHPRFTSGLFEDVLNTHSFALEWTFPCVMSFYIEVEHTGLHSQFYDKFNIRYHLSQVMMSVWNNPQHRRRLLYESKTNVERFVQFVNLLLNDVTYLLDEGLSKLIDINRLQKELESTPPTDGAAQPPPDRREREQLLATTERQASSYISLATETVSLLNKFTAFVPDAFVYPEVVDRLARMLNFNQVVLTGDKCKNLKVRNPEKYRFNPKDLLSAIVDIYLNLRVKQAFVIACARDGRSYRKEVFMKTCVILRKYNLKPSSDVALFERFVDAVEEAKRQDEEGEEELGDIPDHFLDPLMYTIMENPVILPTSKISIDLATIKSHLLSDPTDPFNRSPLKIEDVVPNVELKSEIESFKRERRAKKH